MNQVSNFVLHVEAALLHALLAHLQVLVLGKCVITSNVEKARKLLKNLKSACYAENAHLLVQGMLIHEI